MTRKEWVLSRLLRMLPVTHPAAIHDEQGWRIADAIYRLRREGVAIETEIINRIAVYRLATPSPEAMRQPDLFEL